MIYLSPNPSYNYRVRIHGKSKSLMIDLISDSIVCLNNFTRSRTPSQTRFAFTHFLNLTKEYQSIAFGFSKRTVAFIVKRQKEINQFRLVKDFVNWLEGKSDFQSGADLGLATVKVLSVAQTALFDDTPVSQNAQITPISSAPIPNAPAQRKS
jgi:hypothetical protein